MRTPMLLSCSYRALEETVHIQPRARNITLVNRGAEARGGSFERLPAEPGEGDREVEGGRREVHRQGKGHSTSYGERQGCCG